MTQRLIMYPVMLIGMLAGLTAFNANAQDTLIASPDAYYLDTVNRHLRLGVQVSDITKVKAIHFMLGTAPDQADLLQATGEVYQLAGSYYLRYNYGSYYVLGKYAHIIVKLDQAAYTALRHVTVYAEDTLGALTPRLYLAIP